MSAYEPFRLDYDEALSHNLCSLRVVDSFERGESELVGEFNGEICFFKVYKSSEWTIVRYGDPYTDNIHSLRYNTDAKVEVELGGVELQHKLYGLNNALMLLYALYAVKFGAYVIHSSVIEKDGKGYLFMGKSGTGKSTHSRMWLSAIDGSELLNDDNPIVRVEGDVVKVYGSPWSGKTSCYRNRVCEVGAFVRIVRAPQNELVNLSSIKSYASLLPSCSCIRWDKDSTNLLHSAVERSVELCQSFEMRCLPNENAAEVCYTGLIKR